MKKNKEKEELYQLICLCSKNVNIAYNKNCDIRNKLSFICKKVNRTVECDMYRYLNNDVTLNKKNVIKIALETVFGKDFHKDENVLNCLNNVFKISYHGKIINKPTSEDEFVDLLIMLGDIANNEYFDSKKKTSCILAIKKIQNYIANKMYNAEECIKETSFVIEKLKEIIDCYINNKKIELSQKDSFYKVINHGLSVTLEDDNETKVIQNNISDFIEEFINIHNSSLVKTNEEKINKKTNKYFKKLTEIPYEQLSLKNFPKFSNPNFIDIMEQLLEKFSERQCFELSAALSVHYANYYKDKNSKKEYHK